MGSFSAMESNLAGIITDNVKYIVPPFQRPYAWKSDQITQFSDDIFENYRKAKAKPEGIQEYFFGPMVFVRRNNREFMIVDGQQRLATSCMFLAVIRDILNAMDDTSNASEVNRLIQQPLVTKGPRFYRLTLGQRNQDFFEKFVLTMNNPEEKIVQFKKTNRDNRNIYFAYKTFYDDIKKHLPVKQEDHSSFLLALATTFVYSFTVIKIEVNSTSDAYRIFETLNDRGLELTIADLLKNYVLENCGSENQELILKKWENIIDELESNDLDSFLRHHWIANYDVVQKQDLYDKITAGMKEKPDIVSYTDSLLESSKIYQGLKKPESDTSIWWNDEEIIDSLKDLEILNSKVCKPVLLVGRKNFGKDEFKELANICATFFFRSKTISDAHASALENLMGKICVKIREGKKIKEIRNELKNDQTYPDDTTFRQQFTVWSVKNMGAAKYALVKLEIDSQGGQKNADVKPIDTITVEHIIPKTVNEKWDKYLKSKNMEYEKLVDRLGNLTLLKREKNSSGSNDLFESKKQDIYFQSQISLTKNLTKISNWDEDALTERQNNFAEKAVKIWAL